MGAGGVCASKGTSYGGGSAFHQPMLRSILISSAGYLRKRGTKEMSRQKCLTFIDDVDVNFENLDFEFIGCDGK